MASYIKTLRNKNNDLIYPKTCVAAVSYNEQKTLKQVIDELNGGVPNGGTKDQILIKQSATNQDVAWQDINTILPADLFSDSYVKKSGDTMTGDLTVPKVIGNLQGNASTADHFKINNITSGADLNNLTPYFYADGNTSICSTLVNKPSDMPVGEIGINTIPLTYNSYNYSVQTIVASNSNSNLEIYARKYHNGTFGDWKKLLTDANYNQYALSLTGGTVNGNIIANSFISNEVSEFKKDISVGEIRINNKNSDGDFINSTTGGMVFGIYYDDPDGLSENGITQIRGSSGSFGLASHCAYTNGTGEKAVGKRCFYKNAENNYCKNNNYALTPTALILHDDGHLKYYIGNTKVYSKNEEVIMNEYEVLHTGNLHLADNHFIKKTGDTMTGTLKFSSYNGIYTRHIDGENISYGGNLYLNYHVNAPIHVGNGGSYTISADGSYYSGTSSYARESAMVKEGNIRCPQAGWYKIASYASTSDTPRSQIYFEIVSVGGSTSPSACSIYFELNWGSLGCNRIVIDGNNYYVGGARITKDTSLTYLEVYLNRTTNDTCRLYVPYDRHGGITNSSWVWYNGDLSASVATATGLTLMHNRAGYSTTNSISAETGDSHFYRVYGAVWNDYAEFRKVETIEPGRCVTEDKSGEMKLSEHRLERGCEITSDTYGFAIGETDDCKTPIAVSGRVLAYPYEDRNTFELGAPVCSGPNGTVSQMTEEEERMYPSRIIGTVSEIPNYETWGTGNVPVNGRIWIRIK